MGRKVCEAVGIKILYTLRLMYELFERHWLLGTHSGNVILDKLGEIPCDACYSDKKLHTLVCR